MPPEHARPPAQVAPVPQEITGQPRRVVVGSLAWRQTFAALRHRNFRLFFSLWGGSVADRHSKRAVVLWTQTGMMVLAFVFAALVWTGRVQPRHIPALAALGGGAMAFDMPARQAFMVEMTNREDLMNAVSLNSSIVNGARIVGPSVAGLLMAQAGLAMCFFLNGLSFLAVIAGLLLMRLPRFVP